MKTRRIFVRLLVALFLFTSVARAGEPFSPDNHAKPDPLATQKSLQGNLHVGEFTGAAIYEYPIDLPPGRSGLTPSLAFTYNSQENNMTENLVGYRWNLTQFSIRRANKHGVDKMYEETNFIAETPAGGGELLPIQLNHEQHGEYGLKVEGAFARYEYLEDGSWVVTDKSGLRYTFGITEEARQFDPAEPARVYAWFISEIRDPNDNFIRYTYAKEGNQVYPRQILYTGHGEAEGIFEVRFNLFSRFDTVNAGYSRGFRVQTTRFIGSIEIYAQGALRQKVDLAYSDVSSLGWQTLISITETGYSLSGMATALPPTAFQYSESAVAWVPVAEYVPDWPIESCDGYGECQSKNVIQWDMNGDGLDDFEYIGNLNGNPQTQAIRALNNGQGGWTKIPGSFLGDNPAYDYSLPTLATKVLDFNGDARTDFVTSADRFQDFNRSTFSSLQLSDGRTIYDTLPVFMQLNTPESHDNAVVIGDLNGDSLPDMVQRVLHPVEAVVPPLGGQLFDRTCLNAGGDRCELTNLWHSPRDILEYIYANPAVTARRMALQDCNLDGLADLQFLGSGGDVYINDGKGGWIRDLSANACPFGTGTETNTVRQADLNGDGLMDWVNAYYEFSPGGQRLTTTTITLQGLRGRIETPGVFPVAFGALGNSPHGLGVRLMDLNGDLLPDFIQSFFDVERPDSFTVINRNIQQAWINAGERPYFLKHVQSSLGGTLDITYSTSAQERRADGTIANPNLPINVTVVKTIRTTDGLGTASELRYAYEDGYYHFNGVDERGLAGFRVITKTDSLGFSTKTYFHQSEGSIADPSRGETEDHFSKSGQPYRLELYDNSGRLVQFTVNRWERRDLGSGRSFPHLARTVARLLNPAAGTAKTTAQEFTYDAFGNLSETRDYGEVQSLAEDGSFADLGNDLLRTAQVYVSPSELYLAGLPAEAQMFDQAGALRTHQRFYYDILPLGQANRGNLTRQESWLDTDDRWIGMGRTFDEFGMMLTETNPRGNIMTFIYDEFHLYPVRITNPLGHILERSYDLSAGQAVREVDSNGIETVQAYDGLGRLLEVQKSDPLAPQNLVTLQTLSYQDSFLPHSVHETLNAGNGITVERFVYLDGLGRTIQEKQEGDQGQAVTTGTIFDERGFARKTLQPYFSSTFDFEPMDPQALSQEFTYDVFGRVTQVTNPLGITTTAYDLWRQIITDPNGNQKEFEYDARGKLLAATEHAGMETYVTRYTHDPLGRMTQMTDAEWNQREFTYDSLGRRLTQSAPHRPEATASLWRYQYDDNGNLIGRTDPKTQEVRYNFDTLDRLITEDFTGTPNADYEFLYDEGTYGLGRLGRVRGPSYTREFGYDPWGRPLEDRKTIFDRSFALSTDYDLLSGVTTLRYPDEYQVDYAYDGAHQLHQVTSGDQVFATVRSYTPLGQMTELRLGNGTIVTNNYDPAQLYRLTGKLGLQGETRLQDLFYSYDPVGNLMMLADRSESLTAKQVAYQYDPLYRLTQAAYTGTANEQDITLNYSYSPTGNILENSQVGAYTYSPAHPHAAIAAGDLVFDYDANGNMSERRGETLEYDYRDRLLQSGEGVRFLYGEGDARLAKIDVSTGDIKYYPFEVYEEDREKQVKYIFAGPFKIAKIEVELPQDEEDDGDDGDDGDGDDDGDDGDDGDNDDEDGDDDGDDDPGDDDGDDGGEGGNGEPVPVPSVESVALGGGGGGGGGGYLPGYSSSGRPVLDPKKLLGLKRSYAQADSYDALPRKLRPQVVATTDVGFKNLRITYEPDQVTITWDAMSPEVTDFRIYRSKHAFDDPDFGFTSEFVTTLKSSGRTQRFVDTKNPKSRFAYRVAGLNSQGEILVTSVQLDPAQIYLFSDETTEVNFAIMSRVNFDQVKLVGADTLIFGPGRSPSEFRLASRGRAGTITSFSARFLTCSLKQNGKAACQKADEKTVKVFTFSRPRQASAKKSVSFNR